MKFFIRRSSFKILLGLLTVLTVVFGLSSLVLDYRYWLLIINNFFVLVAVLFADDLRNILYRLGLFVESVFKRLTFRMRKKDGYSLTSNATIDEVAKACFKMASEGTGALICFEKINSLEEFQKVGTVINASSISAELLLAIFDKSSPIHDGAVVIKNNKLLSAGCMLPASQDLNLDKSFGSRHRAAIGLTEGHDSIVVIVSEEKKAVFVVKKGKVSPMVSSTEKLILQLHEALDNE